MKRLLHWKTILKTIASLLLLIFVGAYGYLWSISNYPNIPQYTEISEYRFLTPSSDKVCTNPAPQNGNPNDPNNDLLQVSYQGWCDQQRQHYYRTPQGTEFFGLQYDWISNLEKPVGKKPLVTRKYMQRLGYIYDPAKTPNVNNPSDLPVGLTWHYSPETKAKMLDVSCAACHSAQITFRGTAMVIDGGPGGHALPSLEPTQFIANSIVSLSTTYLNPLKFNRFAKKVLKDVAESEYTAAKKNLRKATWSSIKQALIYAKNNGSLYPTTEGYGRTDALGRIANTVYGDYISPDNYRTADAPVNYPHLWDIWAFDWVQWMGTVSQAMARNINEALGTRAKINLLHGAELYNNSVMVPELHCIETTLQFLKPPQWPEDLMGRVDRTLAAQGATIFAETCASCHGPFPRKAVNGDINHADAGKTHECTTCHGPTMTNNDGTLIELKDTRNHPPVAVNDSRRLGKPESDFQLQYKRDWYWELIHIPLEHIGTDPTSASNMLNNRYDISPLVEQIKQLRANGSFLRLPDPASIPDPTKTGFAEGLGFIGGEVRAKQYRQWGLIEQNGYAVVAGEQEQVADLNGFGESDTPENWRAYRPRPLEGVWATAPFLHNGSVPSIFQLLSPSEERDQVFYLGRKEYNPATLGLEVSKFKGAFKFDTSITGNSNLGHEFNDGLCGDGVIGYELADRPGYCRQFTQRERLALVEYLKIHKDGERPQPESEPHCSDVQWPNQAEASFKQVEAPTKLETNGSNQVSGYGTGL
ncbi:MAG: hypothetical protein JKX81_17640 [Arenicella sp.]|nr:hypothetical protein [Arenicella sp.]